MSVCVVECVCSKMFSETSQISCGTPWDRGRKFIQMVQVICSSLLSTSGGGGVLAGILP